MRQMDVTFEKDCTVWTWSEDIWHTLTHLLSPAGRLGLLLTAVGSCCLGTAVEVLAVIGGSFWPFCRLWASVSGWLLLWLARLRIRDMLISIHGHIMFCCFYWTDPMRSVFHLVGTWDTTALRHTSTQETHEAPVNECEKAEKLLITRKLNRVIRVTTNKPAHEVFISFRLSHLFLTQPLLTGLKCLKHTDHFQTAH